jgi:glutamine cyclotransferase
VKTVAVLLFVCIVAWAAGAAENSGHVEVNVDRILKQSAIPVYNYKIMETYPHDTTSYTEGLVVEKVEITEVGFAQRAHSQRS